ncbi:SpoVR family protein [Sporosarcina sp. FSL W8-0480]|uniref:SpoVR family protein n=1 Tax=Sporosarcina sp. FSL W8-0480 TaxID=2954701 RepID=UPI0030DA92FF
MTDRRALQYAVEEITEIAKGFGLDFYPMRYEICPADIIYTFGAYGMPTRFSHWSFGKQFHKMKLQYDLGLSQIYELVINSNPCYAFLLESNTLIQNKLIIAHVLAHCDFFKNNARFANTRRDMVESMTATAERIANYEMIYGKDEVEQFLDAVLAIQEHIDPSLVRWRYGNEEVEEEETKPAIRKTAYDDLWEIDHRKLTSPPLETTRKRFPAQPEKDILLFILEHSRELKEWQRDILTMIREEMLYFWPQMETKIMNEGWATFWHQRILREMDLTADETIEFAKLNANVIQPSRTSINPYYLGLKIFEDIERRYDNPTKEMMEFGVTPNSGREKMFEVREMDSDISFIRNYLTKDIVQQEDMYVFEKKGSYYKISDKEYRNVQDRLIAQRVNCGFPYILVHDGDYVRNGELYLVHKFEGTELDVPYLENVLPYVHQLWGRIVHLETYIDSKQIVFSYDGKKVHRRYA